MPTAWTPGFLDSMDGEILADEVLLDLIVDDLVRDPRLSALRRGAGAHPPPRPAGVVARSGQAWTMSAWPLRPTATACPHGLTREAAGRAHGHLQPQGRPAARLFAPVLRRRPEDPPTHVMPSNISFKASSCAARPLAWSRASWPNHWRRTDRTHPRPVHARAPLLPVLGLQGAPDASPKPWCTRRSRLTPRRARPERSNL